MKLYIGNKNYSSWSMRPWLAMTAKGMAFEEELVPFNDDAGNPEFAAFSPTVKVPVLVDDGLTIWESLAILEYLADKFPEKGFWPEDFRQRALARCAANEMHGGFQALRNACPMNMRREIRAIVTDQDVHRDVARIETLWAECLERSGGPFLFGEFCNADAMYAPVVNRIEKYALSDHEAVKQYSVSMKSHPAWLSWEKSALEEPWIVTADEA